MKNIFLHSGTTDQQITFKKITMDCEILIASLNIFQFSLCNLQEE